MAKRPHIIIFNPDQWRADVMGHLGNPAAVTPNLDRLAREDGVSFRHAFCQNPVCTPSRCSFMTGWYPHVRGHRTMNHMLHLDRDETTLLRVLKEHGYHVWWGGKNDLISAKEDESLHCSERHWSERQPKPIWSVDRQDEWRGEPGSDSYYSFYVGELDTGGEPYYRDNDWAHIEGAIERIRSWESDQPLCIFLPLIYPHPPYAVEEPWYSMIDRDALPPRTPAPDGWPGKPAILQGIAEMQSLHGWDEERWTELRATYYGMCARLDHQYGLLVEALQQAEMYDDSAIFIFSDHGDFTGDYGLVEKTENTFEECLTNVPFLVKPPANVPVKPRVSQALVELVDFAATVYDLAGIDPGYDHFGQSLLPVLADRDGADSHRDAVFCEGGRRPGELHASAMERNPESLYWPRISFQTSDQGPHHCKAVMCRTHELKYVRRLGESDELYDLHDDPDELVNRIDDPACAERLTQLKDRMLEFFLQTGDVVPRQVDPR